MPQVQYDMDTSAARVMDYDAERALWIPGRRRFFLMGGLALAGTVLGVKALSLTFQKPAISMWTTNDGRAFASMPAPHTVRAGDFVVRNSVILGIAMHSALARKMLTMQTLGPVALHRGIH